jgi:MFS superfamily sulfate permease-like transporter
VLVIGSGINDIDVSGEERLRDVVENFRDSGVEIYFSSLKAQVYEALRRGKLFDLIGADHFFRTKEMALDSLEQTYDAGADDQGPVPAKVTRLGTSFG